MNDLYTVKYLPLFYTDLYNITHSIKYKLQNPIAADNFLDNVELEIKKRIKSPIGYETYKSKKNRKFKYYKIYIKIYTVFYTVHDNIIEIRRILSNRRNFDTLI